jgi:hypothetical protein
MALDGWIRIYRSTQDHWLWQDKPFSKGQAWMDLLLLMNHKDGAVFFRQEKIDVERGQRVTSILKLSERWGWSRKKTTLFLNHLKQDNMISMKIDNRKTIITVVNYGFYQGGLDGKVQQEQQETLQQGSQQRNTNKNENNILHFILSNYISRCRIQQDENFEDETIEKLQELVHDYQDLEWWQAFFDRVFMSDFLMKRKHKFRKSGFKFDLKWLLDNIDNVLSGKYDPDNFDREKAKDTSETATWRIIAETVRQQQEQAGLF